MAFAPISAIEVKGALEHNLKNVDVSIERGSFTVITGVSGSGKSSLAFDTILAEAQRRFFYTLSHYSRQFLDLSARPAVRSLSGLSPAISLAQNETMPSRRATVGTLTDVGELLAVLLARFGEQRCPEHDLPTSALSPQEIAEHLGEKFAGKTVALVAPVVEAKKGVFKTQLTAFAERGFLKAIIDGDLVALAPSLALAKEEKHTIKLVVDLLKVKEPSRVGASLASETRLVRSIETALGEGRGFGEALLVNASGFVEPKGGFAFSTKGGCPTCGFSWPKLDSRHFSANSLGKCVTCQGLGYDASFLGEEAANDEDLIQVERAGLSDACPACQGTGLAAELRGIRLFGHNPHELYSAPVKSLRVLLEQATAETLGTNSAFRRVAEEALAKLHRIEEIGLGYLALSRRVRSLSGGEGQRLKLAGILAENLRGVLYVLDEPSQGLHPEELDLLLQALKRLKAGGNTLIVVDHDEMLMRAADWIIDLGPGGGARGGRIMAKFRPGDAANFINQSVTARYLSGANTLEVSSENSAARNAAAIEIKGATLHNLRIDSVRFPLGALTVVTGVSGAGKSSLVLQTLYPNASAATASASTRKSIRGDKVRGGPGEPASLSKTHGSPGVGAKSKVTYKPRHCESVTGADLLTQVLLVDRRPVAKSSVSMPATYLDVFGVLRDIYAAQPDAQLMGLTARSFSLSADAGRCQECKGRGELALSMRFLADARVRCPVCKGQRYQSTVLGVKYLGLSINDALELTLDEAVEHFRHHKKIVQKLLPAVELGLGYLKLGQPSASLSGGEAQRLKLVPPLSRRQNEGVLLILDEPTTGLHSADVARLLPVLKRLVRDGATIVMIEHSPDAIKSADWEVALGPGAAAEGGRLLSQGPPVAKIVHM